MNSSRSFRIRSLSLVGLVALVGMTITGCEGASGDGSGGASGTGGSSSGGNASGGAATGGSASGGSGSGSGGAQSGGSGNGSGGLAQSGGAANGSGGASGGSSGGGSAAGGQGSGGDGSGGMSGLPPSPSAGCSSPNANPSIANSLVGTPDGYDGSTPVPVIFAFHAAGNQNNQLQGIYQNTVVGENYLMIYLAATNSSGWTLQNDQGRFDTAFDEVMNEACVDENRVFATGHSSGAQFIVQLLCDGETRFDGVAPVASSVYCQNWEVVPALVIHGVADTERQAYGLNDGNGEKDLQPYLSSNGCGDVSTPSDIDTGTTCSGSIDPGCVEFDGCDVRTTWCNHNDPQYLQNGNPTNHGVPCFAPAALHDFFSAL